MESKPRDFHAPRPEIVESLLHEKDREEQQDIFLDHAKDFLTFALQSLNTGDQKQSDIAAKIIQVSLLLEDFENPGSRPGIQMLKVATGEDYQAFVEPLLDLLKSTMSGPDAIAALWVCCLQGAKIEIEASLVEPYLDKSYAKHKRMNSDVQTLAFLILVHSLCQQGRAKLVVPYLKGKASFKKALFDELTTYAAREYEVSAFTEMALKELQAKGEGPVRNSVEILWSLLKRGSDISGAIAFLKENQARLSMFTEAMKVLAGYLIVNEQWTELEKWLADTDPQAAARAYRGIHMAARGGLDMKKLEKQPGIVSRLKMLESNEKLHLPELEWNKENILS
ncbi:MAG: hypothetical protein ACLQMF_03320 [Rectinemataceae bacterium]